MVSGGRLWILANWKGFWDCLRAILCQRCRFAINHRFVLHLGHGVVDVVAVVYAVRGGQARARREGPATDDSVHAAPRQEQCADRGAVVRRHDGVRHVLAL